MSHQAQQQFVASVRERFPEAFRNKRVLEVGSAFINGSVREFFSDCDYIGVDLGPHAGVDVVAEKGAAEWLRRTRPEPFDTVISCECLEHDEHWQETIAAMVEFTDFLLVITCAGSRRAEHGTRRTAPNDVAVAGDHYRGLDEIDLRGALPLRKFVSFEFRENSDPADTYFWGLKA